MKQIYLFEIEEFMGAYFSFYEFTKSDTAKRLGIENNPNEQETENLIELMRFMDNLRGAWTEYCKEYELGTGAIRINSGFRCEELNNAVGGSKTSAHRVGYACDMYPCNGRLSYFQSFLLSYLKDKRFDQMILYPTFVHIGLKNQKGEQRKQIFSKE